MPINYKKYPQPGKFRHHVSAHNYLPFSELKNVPENYPPTIESIDWKEVFGSGNPPDILDLGCGKGRFLLALAEQSPDKNVLGIDVREIPIGWINSIIDGEKLPNVRALYYSLANGLKFLEPGTIERAFYLFPDPWVKQKHYRRRAFTPDFVEEVFNVISSEGEFCIATDVEEVNQFHEKILTQHGKFDFRRVQRDEWDYPYTNKESFCIEKNIEVYRLICRKD